MCSTEEKTEQNRMYNFRPLISACELDADDSWKGSSPRTRLREVLMVQLDTSAFATGLSPVQKARGAGRWKAAALSLVGFALLAAAVVTSQSRGSVELKQDETVSLFKSALASQRSDLAKHRAAEAKAEAQARKSALGGITAGDDSSSGKKGMSDAALFKEAVTEQKTELDKTRAKRAKLAEAVKRGDGGDDHVPSSRRAQLSDAKLFQDALKEQHRERDKDSATLKAGLKAAMKKSKRASELSKAAQQAKVNSELQEILGAAADNHDDTAPAKSKTVAVVHQGAVAAAHKKKPVHASSSSSGSSAPAHKAHKGPSGAVHHRLSARGRSRREDESRNSLKVLSAMRKEAMGRDKKPKAVVKKAPAPQMLDKKDEESLYKLLSSSDHGSPGALASVKQAAHAARKSAAMAAVRRKQHTLHKAVAVKHDKRSAHSHHGGGMNWAKEDFANVDKTLHSSHTPQSYERAEIARSDALEKSLINGA